MCFFFGGSPGGIFHDQQAGKTLVFNFKYGDGEPADLYAGVLVFFWNAA